MAGGVLVPVLLARAGLQEVERDEAVMWRRVLWW